MELELFHRNRNKYSLLHYGVILESADKVFFSDEKKKEALLVLAKETISEWGCIDVGSYVCRDALVLKIDAPIKTDLPSFANTIKTRTQRLLKKYSEDLWVNGYFIFTIGPAEDVEEKVLSFLKNGKEE